MAQCIICGSRETKFFRNTDGPMVEMDEGPVCSPRCQKEILRKHDAEYDRILKETWARSGVFYPGINCSPEEHSKFEKDVEQAIATHKAAQVKAG